MGHVAWATLLLSPSARESVAKLIPKPEVVAVIISSSFSYSGICIVSGSLSSRPVAECHNSTALLEIYIRGHP